MTVLQAVLVLRYPNDMRPGFASESDGLKRKFGLIYKWNLFFGKESRSGRGSDYDQTEILRYEIPRVLEKLGVESLLDIPCGDLHWISRTNLRGVKYTGIDIVPQLISKLQIQFGGEGKLFQLSDITREVPPGKFDAILCRDLLVHLSTADIFKTLSNLQATGAKYLLTTHFTDMRVYKELTSIPFLVGWRPINLMEAPFLFPEPMIVINENCTEGGGRFADKSIGVWNLQALTLPKVALA